MRSSATDGRDGMHPRQSRPAVRVFAVPRGCAVLAAGMLALAGASACTPSSARLVHPVATSKELGVGDTSVEAATERKFAYDANGPLAANAEALKAQVVRIEVEHATGTAVGAGVILCASPGTVFVLTADHVLTGGGPTNEWGEKPDLFHGVRSIRVSFYKNTPAAVSGSPAALVAAKDSAHDVALLRLTSSAQGKSPPMARRVASATVRTGDAVRTFGHSTLTGKEWLPENGQINEVRDFIIFRPALDTGYSGGPVFDAAGVLVGINSHVLAGITEAVPIDTAVAGIKLGLAAFCQRGVL